jgi:hypothetical protein
MVIDGIGLILTADNDPFFLRKVTPNTFMSCGFGGAITTYKWGPMLFWPGGSGLFGLGQDHFEPPALPGGQIQLSGSVTSGIPGAEDYAKQLDTIIWGPKGQADSTYSAQVLVTRAVTWTATARAATAPASADGFQGVQAFTPPAQDAEGSYADFWLRLFGTQVGPRSKNR